MASDVDIANLALAKLGSQPIVSFQDNNSRASLFLKNYPLLRDRIQRVYRWNFTRKYLEIAALVDKPPFEYSFRYPLPSDYLRLELAGVGFHDPSGQYLPGISFGNFNNVRMQDYRIVGNEIWSNSFSPMQIIYAARITDSTKFDAAFVESFAAYLAWQLCETTTNSNSKKQELRDEFNFSIREAIITKSIENPPETIPDDSWMASRLTG